MEKIKLFEDFILEMKSKRLEDINDHLRKLTDNLSAWSITTMLYYILVANANSDESLERIGKKHTFIDSMLNDDELTFDMDKAIENYKKILEYTKGHIKSGRGNNFFKETEHEKQTLKTIENILDYYKKNKNVESVDFHKFVKYVYKVMRVRGKTDKNSEASINNMLDVILKNGIDVLNIEKEIIKYEKEKRNDHNLRTLTEKCLRAGELDGDERDNDSRFPVFYTVFWNGYTGAQIVVSLFVQKKEYILGMGYVGQKTQTDVVVFNNKGEQTSFGDDRKLKILGATINTAIKEFGKDNFKKILEDIFEIFAKNGADVKFNYEDLMKNMKNFLE